MQEIVVGELVTTRLIPTGWPYNDTGFLLLLDPRSGRGQASGMAEAAAPCFGNE